MAVIVDRALTGTKKYEEGTKVLVDNGHLLIQRWSENGSWENLAIHAPERWRTAEVVEATKS